MDQGIAAETSGDGAQAIRYYRSAIEADPGFAPAHMNLGIALQAAGDVAGAIESYERAIAADAAYDAAYYNLALAHLRRSQHAEAEAAFRSALRLREDFPEAWVGLADALEMLGRDEDAISALDRAIALRSDYVGALLNATALLVKVGRYDSAAASDRRVLELEPENYMAQCRLGKCLQKLGQLAEAETRYREALKFKPDYLEAKICLALLLKATGRAAEAVPLLFEAVASAPADAYLRTNLVDALFGIGLTRAGKDERKILLDLTRDDNVSLLYLQTAIVTLMKSDAGFAFLRESARSGDDPFDTIDPAVAAFLRDPLLLAALPRMTISDWEVERVFAHLRRCILRCFTDARGSNAADPAVPQAFVCALAQQCFFTGYAYFRDEDEIARATGVRDALEVALDQATATPGAIERPLAVASLYDSLHTIRGCERLLEFPMVQWSDAFRPLLNEQIENRTREREIAMRMPSITAIDDEVSMAVRAQYEENPFPRWVSVSSPGTDTIENLERRFRPGRAVRDRPRPVPVLVAGCGTGHHPIQVARAFPDSEILAVDLSLASLAYAARMTERFAITNVEYRQADILKLGSLDRRFAMIECCGVLHHLDDPMAGWRALAGLLEPDGLMKIALYSEAARAGVRAARDFIRPLNLPPTPDGIRRCRHAIMSLPVGHPARDVATFRDFFTLDGCRDLVMHVQEHQFTLPRIAECLDRLDLQFLHLECPVATQVRFAGMFPGADVGTDLAAWHRFESAHPDTFKSMYTFWCCRK
ncbi:MAG: tetratricopeptide repeat protein [Burkholderiales bacterium]